VSVKKAEKTKEGTSRPGLFDVVAIVVNKFFNIIQPHATFFGQKDAIQCIVIKDIIQDFNFAIDLKIVPTVREPDGLAMSSRNKYLTPEERALAPILSQALFKTQHLANKTPQRNTLIDCTLSVLQHPNIKVDYVSLASMDDGTEIDQIEHGSSALLSAAIKIGSTRLIDNVIITGSNN